MPVYVRERPAECALGVFSGCLLLTLSVWSICSLMEVARAKCRAPSCCLRHPRWHALCPSPCLTLKSSARPLTADSAHPHLRVSHSHLPLPTTNPHYHPSHPDLEKPTETEFSTPVWSGGSSNILSSKPGS